MRAARTGRAVAAHHAAGRPAGPGPRRAGHRAGRRPGLADRLLRPACRTCSPGCARPPAWSGRWCCPGARPASAATTCTAPTATRPGRASPPSSAAPPGSAPPAPATPCWPPLSQRTPRCRCWPSSTGTRLRRPSTAPSRSPRPTAGCAAGRWAGAPGRAAARGAQPCVEPAEPRPGPAGHHGRSGRQWRRGRPSPTRRARTAKLAGLPLGYAGRATLGLGKRLGGRPAEIVAAEVQARTAEQLFKVLGELKGGAMKFGQAMSVFEAALPEHLAGPYRETLTRLQESAPPLPAAHACTGCWPASSATDWRGPVPVDFDDTPAAAASIGQVHRAVWADGRDVAVKVQYPGAGDALLSDLTQIGRMSRLVGMLVPGLDVKPLVAELKARVAEELDYAARGREPGGVRGGVRRRPRRPGAARSSTAPSRCWSASGSTACRCPGSSRGGTRSSATAPACCSRGSCSPARPGPGCCTPTRTPGNFRLLDDGRLVVLDYGAVNRLPDGLPAPIGPLLRLAVAGRRRGRARRAAGRGLRPARRRARRRAAARLPGADPRAGPGRDVPVQPGLAAQPGGRGSATPAHRRTAPGCSSTCRRSTC